MMEGDECMIHVNDSNHVNLLTFELRNQLYGIEVSKIETVVRMVEVNPVPGARKHVLGAINYHGHIIPVIDLGISGISAGDGNYYDIFGREHEQLPTTINYIGWEIGMRFY